MNSRTCVAAMPGPTCYRRLCAQYSSFIPPCGGLRSGSRWSGRWLVALLEKGAARRGLAMAQALVHRASEASRRLAQILDAGRPQTKSVWKPALGLVGAFSVLCLVIVPSAPQLVSFSPENQTMQSATLNASSLSQPQLPAAAVIPAALHTAPLRRTPKPAAVRASVVPEGRPTAPQVVAARLNADTDRTDQRVVPALLIIRTTERVGPNSWVWSVDVLRVKLVTSSQDGGGTVPTAKKT